MNKRIFIIAIFSLIIDQVSKAIVDAFLSMNETIVVIDNFFSLTNVYNTGAAFSIMEGKTWFLSILSVIILIMIFKMGKEFKMNKPNMIALGLLIGGTFGNFGDRLFLGMVRDFLKFNIFGYSFPVFNVADICIVVGVIMLGISILLGEDKLENSSRDGRKDKTR